MTDTRPAMTDAEFEQAARYVDDRWWMTGENLIHVESVTCIEGWDRYGHPGYLMLTPAQRTLMMWSDVVGQVQNGGFVQFCDNFASNLALGVATVDALRWPDLRERFRRAMVEQAGDADEPRRVQSVPPSGEPEKWRESRTKVIRHIARQGKRWWQRTTPRDIAYVEARYTEWQLEREYISAVLSGKLRSGGESLFDFVAPPSDEANDFDKWFYSDETKAASAIHVHDFIIRNRDQLYRPT
jgi:hypothetical protein